ncbi:hypothetical protein NDU88_006215 [Pleurodeles waltl]|uniref:Uncharacterized protein n=1 Tax=Pleurodeles waltl TaxID=8319 RepID=A0AAV7L309_PLEWA|nr:hypothetical protein NDU88_006215 [Pleurodeles waltl]
MPFFAHPPNDWGSDERIPLPQRIMRPVSLIRYLEPQEFIGPHTVTLMPRSWMVGAGSCTGSRVLLGERTLVVSLAAACLKPAAKTELQGPHCECSAWELPVSGGGSRELESALQALHRDGHSGRLQTHCLSLDTDPSVSGELLLAERTVTSSPGGPVLLPMITAQLLRGPPRCQGDFTRGGGGKAQCTRVWIHQ